jgi:hypothetical protein
MIFFDVVMFITHVFFTTNVQVLNLFLFSIETHEKLCAHLEFINHHK